VKAPVRCSHTQARAKRGGGRNTKKKKKTKRVQLTAQDHGPRWLGTAPEQERPSAWKHNHHPWVCRASRTEGPARSRLTRPPRCGVDTGAAQPAMLGRGRRRRRPRSRLDIRAPPPRATHPNGSPPPPPATRRGGCHPTAAAPCGRTCGRGEARQGVAMAPLADGEWGGTAGGPGTALGLAGRGPNPSPPRRSGRCARVRGERTLVMRGRRRGMCLRRGAASRGPGGGVEGGGRAKARSTKPSQTPHPNPSKQAAHKQDAPRRCTRRPRGREKEENGRTGVNGALLRAGVASARALPVPLPPPLPSPARPSVVPAADRRQLSGRLET